MKTFGQIKINNIIYSTTSAAEILYKNTTVEEKLDTIPMFDINNNGNISPSSDVLTYGNIIDNLNSSATDKVLSANQGRILKENIKNIDFSPLEAAINDNSIAISENNVAINKNNTAIESLNINVSNNSTEINNIKSKKISFINTSRLLARITTKGSSYTATEPCFATGFIQGTSSAGGYMTLDGEIIIWSQPT